MRVSRSQLKLFDSSEDNYFKIYFQLSMAHKLTSLAKNREIQGSRNYRLSMPTYQNHSYRNSFATKCQPKPYFRASDMSCLTNLPHLSKRDIDKKVQNTENVNYHKTSTNLLSTLSCLSQKLLQAKSQLTPSKQTDLSEFSAELNTVRQCTESDEILFGSSLLEKMQQSTINFQSQKKLIDAVKSKQNLILMSKIKTYYISQIVQGVVGINQRALQHLVLSLEVLRNVQINNFPEYHFWSQNQILLPMKEENIHKKVLVLDLDETLIHCEDTRMSPSDIQINIATENNVEKAFISIRPYALSFLKKAKKNFQIIVFTASQQFYADAVMDQIDPENMLIDHRLYRNHCLKIFNKIYTKDLSIINRDLSRMVLVDNSPFSYLCQIQNGIPILSYNGGADSELLRLQKYLDLLIKQKDVRSLNLRTFKLNRYGEYNNCQQLIKGLYCNQNDYS